MLCGSCGREGALEQVFHVVRRRRAADESYCPDCWQQLRRRLFRRASWLLLVLAVVLAAASELGWEEAAIAANLVLVYPLAFVTIPLHELGHAAAAWLVRIPVLRIHLGEGAVVWRGRILGLPVWLHAIPTTGLTLLGAGSRRLLRPRHLIATAGGPLANLLLIAGSVSLVDGLDLNDDMTDGVALGSAFALANVFVLMTALWPRRLRIDGEEFLTDGRVMAELLWWDRGHLAEMFAGARLAETGVRWQELRRDGDYEGAARVVRAALKDGQDDGALREALAYSLSDMGQLEEARAVFLECLGHPDLDPMRRAYLQNNVAVCTSAESGRQALAEADRLSAKALTEIGWATAVRATRGSVLVECGQVEEGLALLRDLNLSGQRAADRASVACAMSVGYAKLGRLHDATQQLQTATRLDPRHPALQRCRRLIDES